MPSLVEIGPVIIEKKIFKNHKINVFLLCLSNPQEMVMVLHLNKFEFPFPNAALCQFGSGSGEKDF